MELSQFAARDWLLFLAPYTVWCSIAGCLWRFILRPRIERLSARAAVFSILFAPTLFPIVREAFVLGPASASLVYVGLLALRFRPPGWPVVTFVVDGGLLPMAVVWALYRFGSLLRTRSSL